MKLLRNGVTICFAVAAIFVLMRIPTTASASDSNAANSGGAKCLFIDDHWIQQSEGLRRVFHEPLKHTGPIIVPDQPWEDDFIQHWQPPAWSPERGCWQIWYYGGNEYLPCYAESADGLKWTKPRLGLVDWKESKENNIIDLGIGRHGAKENFLAVLRDDRDPDPERRYKGITHVRAKMTPLVSADGLRWQPLEGDPFYSDDQYRLNYDALHNRFAAMVKFKRGRQGRVVGLSLSEDFTTWNKPKLIFAADETDQELGRKRIEAVLRNPDRRHPQYVKPEAFSTDVYTMPVFTYGDIYLGLPVLFNHSGTYDYNQRTDNKEDGILYPTLVTSRDLEHWDRLNREPFLSHSPLSDKENWDHAMIHVSCPIQRGNELWFYYTGARFTHLKREIIEEAKLRTSSDEPLRAIFLARMRLDGFASLEAGETLGNVVTKPLKVTDDTMLINADASRGELRVELRDATTEQTIPGYSFVECRGAGTGKSQDLDGTRLAIYWQDNSNLSKLRGQQVKVCVSLRNAHLYAISFDRSHK